MVGDGGAGNVGIGTGFGTGLGATTIPTNCVILELGMCQGYTARRRIPKNVLNSIVNTVVSTGAHHSPLWQKLWWSLRVCARSQVASHDSVILLLPASRVCQINTTKHQRRHRRRRRPPPRHHGVRGKSRCSQNRCRCPPPPQHHCIMATKLHVPSA